MKIFRNRGTKKNARLSKQDLQMSIKLLREDVEVIGKFNLKDLKLLKAEADAKVENMKQIGFVVIVVGFFISFYMELFKKIINMNNGWPLIMFLVVILGLLAIAGTFSKLYKNALLQQKLLELKIIEKERK